MATDIRILRLSDSYEQADGGNEINLELVVKLFNINRGYNQKIR